MAQEVQTELISMLREAVDAIQAATPDALDVAATVLWLDALSAVLFGVPMLVLAVGADGGGVAGARS
jgi:Ca2+/H+ antiporter